MPALGLGTWQLRGEEAERAVVTALGMGYRHVDTAAIYENEEAVGAGLKASGVPRDHLFLTTKIWHDSLTPDGVHQAIDASLKRLGTDYVDLLHIHWPDPDVSLADTLGAMQAVRDAGKTRLVGVSNFTPSLLAEALEIVPDLAGVQVEYHAFLGQPTLLELVRKHGLMLTAYSPLARGRVVKDETIQTIAAVHGKSAVQVALRWLIQQDRVAAIPKASSDDHLAANLAVFDFALSEDEMDAIDALPKDRRLVNPDFAPSWDG